MKVDFTACPRVPGRAYNGANGKKIVKVDSGVDKKSGSSYGVYRCCESCQKCPLKEKCMKSSKKDRKEFQAYMEHWELRNKARILLESDKGFEIRVNRSIMAEGSFAQMKSNNKLRCWRSPILTKKRSPKSTN